MPAKRCRQIECSRPEYRKGLFRASLLFGALLLAEFALIHQLVSNDLSRRHFYEALAACQDDIQQVGRQLNDILKQEGKSDLFKLLTVKETLTTFTQMVNDRLAKQLAVHHIAIYDQQGRLVAWFRVKLGRLIRTEAVEDPEPAAPPAFQRAGEVPVPDQDGSAGEVAKRSVADRRDSSAAGTTGPPQYGRPAPPAGVRMDSVQREMLIVAPVASGKGEQPKGSVVLGLNEELLETQVAQVRKDLLKKLAAGAFLSLVVLVVGFLYVLKLLQKTRRLEAEAQMADRLAYIGTLASGLAHEIRNPLNAMNMNLQMIEEEMTPLRGTSDGGALAQEGAPEEETRALLESTKGEIKRLERLVSSFLAYARPSALNLEERDLNRTLEEVVLFLKAELASKGIAIATRFSHDVARVEIDEPQFKQAILNILVNARQVLGPGGSIEISTAVSSEGEPLVRIADNGPGIASEQLDKIFEVFYSTRRGGTGLGLPIAQRIIENHGGRIDVESEMGRGTLFTIVLPHRQRTHAIAAPAAEAVHTG